ncbi:MAG: ribonuclease H [Lapillicoccus sp.]
MIARYASTCAGCGRPIRVGDEISSAGTGRSGPWVHEGCSAPVPDDLFAVAEASAARATTTTAKPAKRGKPRRVDPPLPAGATSVYTDGACSGNPGPGGWAWAVADGRQGSGGHPSTTNQRMEIQAALEAVRALTDSPLVVVSDSTYVVNCFRDGWWRGWQARGWLTSQKKPVVSRDLWEPLVELVNDRGDVTFAWVKGHSGDVMNDLVDRLAVAQSVSYRAG